MEEALLFARNLKESLGELQAKLTASVCLVTSMEPELVSLANKLSQLAHSGVSRPGLQDQLEKLQQQAAGGACDDCDADCASLALPTTASDSAASSLDGEVDDERRGAVDDNLQECCRAEDENPQQSTLQDGQAAPADDGRGPAEGDLQEAAWQDGQADDERHSAADDNLQERGCPEGDGLEQSPRQDAAPGGGGRGPAEGGLQEADDERRGAADDDLQERCGAEDDRPRQATLQDGQAAPAEDGRGPAADGVREAARQDGQAEPVDEEHHCVRAGPQEAPLGDGQATPVDEGHGLAEDSSQEAPPQPTEEEDPWPEVAPPTDFELDIRLRSRGLYEPTAMRRRRRVSRELAGTAVGVVKGRLSVVVPTMESRQRFHERIWRAFDAQTWPDKELIVVETFSKTPSPFFATKCQEDARIIYVPLKVRACLHLSIGLKRNICTHLASGELLANFDDDDLYAPEYLATMVANMRQQGAEAITLSGWYVVDACTGTVGFFDPRAVCHRVDLSTIDGWTFGYGFSYVYSRAAALSCPYHDVNMNEDWDFYWELRQEHLWSTRRQARKLQSMESECVALLFDCAGICLHTLHGASTSECWAQREVPLHEVRALEVQSLGDIFDAQLQGSPCRAARSRFIPGPPRDRWRSVTIAFGCIKFRMEICAGVKVCDIRPEVKKLVQTAGSSAGKTVLLFRDPPADGQERPEGAPLQDREVVPLRCNCLWAAEVAVKKVVVRVVDMLDLTLSVCVKVKGQQPTFRTVRQCLLRKIDCCDAAAAKVKLAALTIGRRFEAPNPAALLGEARVLFAAGLAEALGRSRRQAAEDRARQLGALYAEIHGWS